MFTHLLGQRLEPGEITVSGELDAFPDRGVIVRGQVDLYEAPQQRNLAAEDGHLRELVRRYAHSRRNRLGDMRTLESRDVARIPAVEAKVHEPGELRFEFADIAKNRIPDLLRRLGQIG